VRAVRRPAGVPRGPTRPHLFRLAWRVAPRTIPPTSGPRPPGLAWGDRPRPYGPAPSGGNPTGQAGSFRPRFPPCRGRANSSRNEANGRRRIGFPLAPAPPGKPRAGLGQRIAWAGGPRKTPVRVWGRNIPAQPTPGISGLGGGRAGPHPRWCFHRNFGSGNGPHCGGTGGPGSSGEACFPGPNKAGPPGAGASTRPAGDRGKLLPGLLGPARPTRPIRAGSTAGGPLMKPAKPVKLVPFWEGKRQAGNPPPGRLARPAVGRQGKLVSGPQGPGPPGPRGRGPHPLGAGRRDPRGPRGGSEAAGINRAAGAWRAARGVPARDELPRPRSVVPGPCGPRVRIWPGRTGAWGCWALPQRPGPELAGDRGTHGGAGPVGGFPSGRTPVNRGARPPGRAEEGAALPGFAAGKRRCQQTPAAWAEQRVFNRSPPLWWNIRAWVPGAAGKNGGGGLGGPAPDRDRAKGPFEFPGGQGGAAGRGAGGGAGGPGRPHWPRARRATGAAGGGGGPRKLRPRAGTRRRVNPTVRACLLPVGAVWARWGEGPIPGLLVVVGNGPQSPCWVPRPGGWPANVFLDLAGRDHGTVPSPARGGPAGRGRPALLSEGPRPGGRACRPPGDPVPVSPCSDPCGIGPGPSDGGWGGRRLGGGLAGRGTGQNPRAAGV